MILKRLCFRTLNFTKPEKKFYSIATWIKLVVILWADTYSIHQDKKMRPSNLITTMMMMKKLKKKKLIHFARYFNFFLHFILQPIVIIIIDFYKKNNQFVKNHNLHLSTEKNLKDTLVKIYKKNRSKIKRKK